MQAQTQPTITGVYQLRGVMEMASAILLKHDSSFEFYFSYGAIDRNGSGKWHWNEKDSTIVLNTPAADRHTSDYSLYSSRKEAGNLSTFRMADENPYLIRYTQFRIYTDKDTIEGGTDEKGFFTMPQQPVKKIELLFELCPERFSTIEIKDNSHNYFEFRLEPWITEVYFNNVVLRPTEEGLTGGHPLLEGHEYEYRKQD